MVEGDASKFEKALKDALDEHGAFKVNEDDGVLGFEDYLAMKLAILKNGSMSMAD